MTPRREAILKRRAKYAGCGTDLSTLKKDKYGKPIWPNSGVALHGKRGGTPMKISNRNAMLRRLHKRVQTGTIAVAELDLLVPAIAAGQVDKATVYGFHPTRKAR